MESEFGVRRLSLLAVIAAAGILEPNIVGRPRDGDRSTLNTQAKLARDAG
jgi:hypothetical protein